MRLQRLGKLNARITGGTDGQGAGDGPVVVLLHGYGAPADDLLGLGRELPAPKGTRFVFPEAPIELQQMSGSRAWWNIDMAEFERAQMTGQPRDMTNEVPDGMAEANAQLCSLLDAVQKEMGVSGEQIVLGGFSQGSMLAMDVALRTDRKLAGLVLFSGTLLAKQEWIPLIPARAGLRVVQTHGTVDPILFFGFAEQLKNELKKGGWQCKWVPFHGQHEIPRPALAAVAEMLTDVLG